MDKSKIVIDKVAFNDETQGFNFKGTFLKEPKGMALIEISRDNQMVREFLFPSYKIWNITAHANDIAIYLKQESDEGLYIAGSDGLGGNAYHGLTKRLS